jgi:hypothetical protein
MCSHIPVRPANTENPKCRTPKSRQLLRASSHCQCIVGCIIIWTHTGINIMIVGDLRSSVCDKNPINCSRKSQNVSLARPVGFDKFRGQQIHWCTWLFPGLPTFGWSWSFFCFNQPKTQSTIFCCSVYSPSRQKFCFISVVKADRGSGVVVVGYYDTMNI